MISARAEARELRSAILLTLGTSARFDYWEDRGKLYDQIDRLVELVPEMEEKENPRWGLITLPPGKRVGGEHFD